MRVRARARAKVEQRAVGAQAERGDQVAARREADSGHRPSAHLAHTAHGRLEVIERILYAEAGE